LRLLHRGQKLAHGFVGEILRLHRFADDDLGFLVFNSLALRLEQTFGSVTAAAIEASAEHG